MKMSSANGEARDGVAKIFELKRKSFVMTIRVKVDLEASAILETLFSAQLAAKHMLKQGSGESIIMITSIYFHSIVLGHRLLASHTLEAGVVILSRAVGVQLTPTEIRCNTVSPGWTESEMTRSLRKQHPHLVTLMNQATSMKKIGQPSDLVGTAAYLLSDASRYTTGTDIVITGGLHVGMIDTPGSK